MKTTKTVRTFTQLDARQMRHMLNDSRTQLLRMVELQRDLQIPQDSNESVDTRSLLRQIERELER